MFTFVRVKNAPVDGPAGQYSTIIEVIRSSHENPLTYGAVVELVGIAAAIYEITPRERLLCSMNTTTIRSGVVERLLWYPPTHQKHPDYRDLYTVHEFVDLVRVACSWGSELLGELAADLN